ncbi:hypothetical protein HMPREF3213_03149 [Heyndrickxia coagulans]|uniref:Uncharacterized protein n=1 Tax=Heyndrickxia coagulans TaxID=1398 RepID=A0A133KEF6_HEYCO|nr:hypothetical protein HMPREF3213_03149 [Heyndrickxia coagulans]
MSPNCLFELVKKDKTHRNRARNVLLKPSKGQIDFYPGPKCLFELVKKDRTRCIQARNVLLNL